MGNICTTLAHIIIVVVGSVVLSLSWSVAQPRWIAGPVSLVLFALVTYLNASLLTKFLLYSHHHNGVNVTDRSYLEAVQNILAILQLNCYHEHGHEAACEYGIKFYMLLSERNGKIKGSIGGVPSDKPIQKVWLVAQAIGDIAFAYPLHMCKLLNYTNALVTKLIYTCVKIFNLKV
ncbi:putative amino acid transporter, transmembrane domain-containing protein [Helianthus anomalus]